MGASAIISPWLEPTTYDFRLRAWHGRPIMMPTPEMVITAWNKGALTPTQVRSQLREQGIDLSPNWDQSTDYVTQGWPRGNWNRTIRSTYVRIPHDTVMRYYHLDIMPFDVADEELLRSGLRLNDTRLSVLQPHLVPTIPACLDARNRGFIDDATLQKYLKCNGATRANERELWDKLRYVWPTPTDLIPFAVRDIWNQDVVTRFEYDAEFPDTFQTFMERAGMGWKPSDLNVTVAPQFDISWARAYWRAHWQMMSPTQASFAVHLLRPSADNPAQSRIANVRAFTRTDFDTVLKIADYPPIIREWLFGLSYTPLTRVDIRRMAKLKVLTPLQVYEAYRDLGYNEFNAAKLRDFTFEDIEAAATSRERARIEGIARNLFLSCLWDRKEFMRTIYAVRRPTAAKRAEFLNLDAAAQANEAAGDANVVFLADVLELQRSYNNTKAAVAAIRKAGKNGLLNRQQVVTELTNLGLKEDCVNSMVDKWAIEGKVSLKQPTAANILKWLIRGSMTATEANFRLSQLGFTPPDIARMIQVAIQDANLAQAREQARLANTAKQQQRAIEAVLREAAAARKAAIADLNRSASKTEIIRLFKKGYMSREEAYTALIGRGVLPKEARAFLHEAIPNGQPTNGEA